jgi:hypothetical protein
MLFNKYYTVAEGEKVRHPTGKGGEENKKFFAESMFLLNSSLQLFGC